MDSRLLEMLPENLSDDASHVLSACEALRAARDHDDLKIDDSTLCATTETLVETLSYSAIEKLAMITWHFNASGGLNESLRSFLRNPNWDNTIWEAVHQSYVRMTEHGCPLREVQGHV